MHKQRSIATLPRRAVYIESSILQGLADLQTCLALSTMSTVDPND